MPQLPVTTVVTPWLILHSISGIGEQRAIIMGVGVDEARRQREPVRAKISREPLVLREVAHRDDAIIRDREIAASARLAAAVDQEGVADDEIGL